MNINKRGVQCTRNTKQGICYAHSPEAVAALKARDDRRKQDHVWLET